MKLYHVSLKRNYKPGDIIHPSSIKQYSAGWGVYVTASPKPHQTLFEFGERSLHLKKCNTYEVRPLHKSTKIEVGNWDDLVVCGAVEVVRCLGQTNQGKHIHSSVFDKKSGDGWDMVIDETRCGKKKYKKFKHTQLRKKRYSRQHGRAFDARNEKEKPNNPKSICFRF